MYAHIKTERQDVFFELARADAIAIESAAAGMTKGLEKMAKADRAISMGFSDVALKLNAFAAEEDAMLAG
jgi:hypothetical protein